MGELNKSIEHITRQIEELFEEATRKELRRIYSETSEYIKFKSDNVEQLVKDNDLLIVREGGKIEDIKLRMNESKEYFVSGEVTPIKVKIYKML